MAKAILEFDLTDGDDRMEHLRAIKSTDMALMIWQLVYNTKKDIVRELEAEEFKGGVDHDYDLLDKVFEKINDLMEEYNIAIDDLIV